MELFYPLLFFLSGLKLKKGIILKKMDSKYDSSVHPGSKQGFTYLVHLATRTASDNCLVNTKLGKTYRYSCSTHSYYTDLRRPESNIRHLITCSQWQNVTQSRLNMERRAYRPRIKTRTAPCQQCRLIRN